MNNEIGRKITSLTLMTIMLAAGFTAFAPGAMPQAAAANANLFVSAENSQFQNHFGGPMVVEVVIIDSAIAETTQGRGEPDVTINGNKLRMVQGTDGNWYGYFADRVQAQRADATVGANTGNGLDFGKFCTAASAGTLLGFSVSQTVGVAVPTAVTAGVDGNNQGTNFGACSATSGTVKINNVVRENKTVNAGGGSNNVPIGQIGFADQTARGLLWPFIQLYNFNVNSNVVVQYNKGGGVQSTTLRFSDSLDDFAKLDLDRNVYPQGAQVHATITDQQLNIDPTDEDVWTFQTTQSTPATYYQLVNENGGDGFAGTGPLVAIDVSGSLSNLMFGDNGVLLIRYTTPNGQTNILERQFTDKQPDTLITDGITVTETAPNTGVFTIYDENDVSQLKTTATAPRGQTAVIDYNDTPRSLLIGFGTGTLTMTLDDNEWNSGETLTVTLVDSDANKNSRSDEDLLFSDPNVDVIPAMRIGNPFTLGVKGTGPTSGTSGTQAQAVFLGNFTAEGTAFNGATPTTASKFKYVDSATTGSLVHANVTVQRFSDRAILAVNNTASATVTALVLDTKATGAELLNSINDPRAGNAKKFRGYNFVNLDIRGISADITNATVYMINSTSTNTILTKTGLNGKTGVDTSINPNLISLVRNVSPQSLVIMNQTGSNAYDFIFGSAAGSKGIGNSDRIAYVVNFTAANGAGVAIDSTNKPVAIDLFSFGFFNDGTLKSERINNYIARIEVEETGDNTGVFEGTLEYIMLNQLNILDEGTYSGLTTVSDDVTFVVHFDLDFEDAVRVTYNDLGADGVRTQISAQRDAPTHSGVVSFDMPTYKIADTVTITLNDADLNTDVDLLEIYTVVTTASDPAFGTVGEAGLGRFSNNDPFGRLLQVEFSDQLWAPRSATSANTACNNALVAAGIDTGLDSAGFTLVETGAATGVFTGNFQIPSQVCLSTDSAPRNTQGLNMKVNYYDFRDASGQIIRVGDSATVRSTTGTVSLDKTVYPVPFGVPSYFASSSETRPDSRSIFPVHLSSVTSTGIGTDSNRADFLNEGVLTVYVQVNDPDFDTSASGEDVISQNRTDRATGPVKVTVTRGSDQVILAYAGGNIVNQGKIWVGTTPTTDAALNVVRQLGPIAETHPTSGIFQFNLPVRYTDGPASTQCPVTESYVPLDGTAIAANNVQSRFTNSATANTVSGNFCILQGDIITVEYTDPSDAAGRATTVTDSATFDLRNGALQSDKSVYIIGSDMILTLIDPDLDLDSRTAETYTLDLIEWDSDAATVTMGALGGQLAQFDPEPSALRETGKSTGIFQTIVEIPRTLNNDPLERGEEIILEYTDWGPSGSKYVGEDREFINLTIFTSNFGATVELDKKVYTWTDKVYITIIAPDHNFDSNRIDEIGASTADPLRISTRGDRLPTYRLVETGPDTGIFTGEVILTGIEGVNIGTSENPAVPTAARGGTGPTNGFLRATENDGISVSYEFSDRETVVGSALIRWNIGEVMWLEASYPARGTGVVRVIDPDMNLNPEAVDNFRVNVWSDSDSGGIRLTVTETSQASGIFEGTVFFTTNEASSGHRLRVAEGDTVTAEYEDNSLPAPYTRADNLRITATSFIGTIVPPLERAPASNPRVVDAFGNTLQSVSVDQQVQITADLTNGQDREQRFAYLVQIQNSNGVTVSLAWITGSLTAGQSFSPALSWTPSEAGTYTATVFVWESVDNPTALSPPVSVNITVR
jgi:hypothetical protein